jgi:hypothetical protein
VNRTRKLIAVGAGIAAAAVLTLALSGAANATTPPSDGGVQPDGSIIMCIHNIDPNLHVAYVPNNGTHGCPAGWTTDRWNIVGPKGATGTQGIQGVAGPAGPAGAPGTSAVLTVNGTTNVTAWPESSGWASDDFTRSVTVTRQHAADNSNCGGAPTCWFYTFQLTDNGTFTTVNGKDSPNGSSSDKVTGAFAGTMQGVAVGSFYADSGTPTGAIPVSATGSAKPASTTNWATLALPASAHAFGTKLTAYSWDYNLSIAAGAGCTAASHQEWLDQINPGDDGQGASDGNVVGATNC